MTSEVSQEDLRDGIVQAKNHHERKFTHFTNNFHIIKSALRYFSVKQGLSFTSSKVSDNFPVAVTVAGSCLTVLKELDVVEARTESSSPDRYLPRNVDMDRLEQVEEVLLENYEINEF